MQSLKLIGQTDVTFATVRNQWQSGKVYDEYDDQDAGLEATDRKYSVITDNLNVYICLKSGGVSGSTQSPDEAGVQPAGVINFTSIDGYIWKYLYTLSSEAASKFLTSAFVPVTFVPSNPGTTADTALVNQFTVQDNAVDGAVYNIKVTNPGSGYTSAPLVTVVGDGDGLITATAVLGTGASAGSIVNININSGHYGSGYTQANVILTGGGASNATARIVLGPRGGFGADARNELRAHYVAINAKLDNAPEHIIDNTFRQIGIIKNPIASTSGSVATADTLSATHSLNVALGGDFPFTTTDTIIEGVGTTASGARGIVDHYDSVNGIIRYHQTTETGFVNFTINDDIVKVINGSPAGTGVDCTQVAGPDIKKYSGEVIFIENRGAVSRSDTQVETIKLVLEL
jgi:hypothetical protein